MSFLKQVFSWKFFKSFALEILFLLGVLISILFVSIAANVFPPFAFVFLIPLIIVVFLFLPEVRDYPSLLFRNLLLWWFPLTIIWPFFVVVQAPGLDLYLSRFVLLALIVLWVYYFSKSPRFRFEFTEFDQSVKYFSWIVLAFILIKIPGIFLSNIFATSMNGFFKELTEAIIPALIALAVLKSRASVEKVVSILAWVGVVVIIVGLVEYKIQMTVFEAYLPGFLTGNKEHIVESIASKYRDGEFRQQSLFGHPLSLVHYLAVALPLILYKLLSAPKIVTKFFWLLISFLLLFIMMQTGSRSFMPAILAEAAVVMLVIAYLILKTQKTNFIGWLYFLAFPFIFVGGMLIVLVGRQLFMGGSDHAYLSTQARFDMWSMGIERMLENPVQALLGFGHSMANTTVGWQGGRSLDSHYLNVLIDFGVFGLIIFVFMIFFTLYMAFKNWIKSDFKDYLQIALLASILGYSVVALISSLPHILHIFYILLALVMISTHLSKQESE